MKIWTEGLVSFLILRCTHAFPFVSDFLFLDFSCVRVCFELHLFHDLHERETNTTSNVCLKLNACFLTWFWDAHYLCLITRSYFNVEDGLSRSIKESLIWLTCSLSKQGTLRKIVSHKNGLSTLASCIVSNLTKSRVLALQVSITTIEMTTSSSRELGSTRGSSEIIQELGVGSNQNKNL
jgi:hypothetical protein